MSDSRKVVNASAILAEIERGERVEYNGVIVVGDLDLNGLESESKYPGLAEEVKVVESPINITSSEIRGNVNLGNSIFQEQVNFKYTNFTGNSRFFRSNFSKSADFWEAMFSGGNANFERTVFSGDDADFVRAVFSGGDANFQGAKFSGGDANFQGAEFSGGDARFSGAKFLRGNAHFWGAEFSGGKARFSEAEFSGGDADFLRTKFSGGDADFFGAEFSGGDANFRYAKFSGGDAVFEGAEFSGGNANFSKAEFNKYAIFEDSTFGNISLSGSFNISLNYVQFDRDAYFENATFHPNTKLDLTRSSYKRMFLPWSSINQKQASASDDDAYLALMRNYMNLGWFEDANDCYYEYRNKRRINEPICIEKITDTLEWLIYGYGVKPTYTVGWIAFLVLLFGLIFTSDVSFKKYIREEIQVVSEDQSTKDQKTVEIKTISREEERINYIVDPLLLSLTTFTSGLTSFLYPSIEYKVEKHTRLVILERLLGSVFLALLITAISKTWLIR